MIAVAPERRRVDCPKCGVGGPFGPRPSNGDVPEEHHDCDICGGDRWLYEDDLAEIERESRLVRFRLGSFVLSYDPTAPRCGIDCECCEFDDGTAPADHARDCDLITFRDGDWSDCTCEGAGDRAKDRKRVRLKVGTGECPHTGWR